jgi:hypothetical protein
MGCGELCKSKLVIYHDMQMLKIICDKLCKSKLFHHDIQMLKNGLW